MAKLVIEQTSVLTEIKLLPKTFAEKIFLKEYINKKD